MIVDFLNKHTKIYLDMYNKPTLSNRNNDIYFELGPNAIYNLTNSGLNGLRDMSVLTEYMSRLKNLKHLLFLNVLGLLDNHNYD